MNLSPVPAHMTHFFQPLDLTVNGSTKQFMRKQFITYYSDAVKKKLDRGETLEDIQIDLRLTTLKPLHAQWLVNMYNFFTSAKAVSIITRNCWTIGWNHLNSSFLLHLFILIINFAVKYMHHVHCIKKSLK